MISPSLFHMFIKEYHTTMISEGKPALRANVFEIEPKGKFLQQQQQ